MGDGSGGRANSDSSCPLLTIESEGQSGRRPDLVHSTTQCPHKAVPALPLTHSREFSKIYRTEQNSGPSDCQCRRGPRHGDRTARPKAAAESQRSELMAAAAPSQ
jgi:hypothetical protein